MGSPISITSIQYPVPPGAITAYAATTAPTGWLACDGAEVSKTTYATLYSVIGDTWLTCTNPLTGTAYSSITAGNFRVPDLRGAFLRGVGTFGDARNTTLAGFQADGTVANGLSATAASSTLAGTATSAGDHSHTLAGATDSQGAHTHAAANFTSSSSSYFKAISSGGAYTRPAAGSIAELNNITGATDPIPSGGAHTHTLTGGTAATTGAHSHTLSGTAAGQVVSLSSTDVETRPLNVGVNFIVKY